MTETLARPPSVPRTTPASTACTALSLNRATIRIPRDTGECIRSRRQS
jgi:hypothetical protein